MGLFFNKEAAAKQTLGSGVGWSPGFIGGRRSASGERVNERTALALPMMQTCVTLLAESMAQLPLEMFRRVGEDSRKAARDHPLYDVLKYRPNPWQTPFDRMELAQGHAGLRGNAFTYIDRDGRGRIQNLYPLSSDNVSVLIGADRRPFYKVGSQAALSQEHIHHVRWFSVDGYTGLSPVMLHADSIGHTQALSEYASKSFRHGTALSGVLERPKEAPAIESQAGVDRITEDWMSKFGGAANAGKVALLQEGMTFKPLVPNNVDADLVAALNLTDLSMARIYKVPLPMTGSMEGATYNNVENLQIQYVIYCLMPWVRRHEQAMMRDLLSGAERREYYIEFNVAGLLRGNTAARYAAYAVGRQWGWLSINDIRRLENLPPVPGGDVYLHPLNMVDATKPIPAQGGADPKAVEEIAKVLS